MGVRRLGSPSMSRTGRAGIDTGGPLHYSSERHPGGDVVTGPGAQDRPFRVDEATIEELHAAIQVGADDTAPRSFSITSTACAPTTGWPACSSRKMEPRSRKRGAPCAAMARAALPRGDGQGLHASCPTSTSTRGRPSSTGAWRRRRPIPACMQQFGMIVGKPDAGQAECARDPQHSRRALGDLPGRLRPPPVGGAAPAGRAARVRDVPQAPGRPRARGRARRDVRTQSRSREDADVRRRVLVQGPVRHEGHANRRPAATPATTSTSRRAITCWSSSSATRARSSSPRPSTPNTTGGRGTRRPPRARQGAAVDAGLPAQHLGRQSRRTPYDTTRSASLGLELGLAACRSAPISSWRASARRHGRPVAARPTTTRWRSSFRTSRCSGFNGGAIGADIYCDRSGILCRTIADCAKVLDALKDPTSRATTTRGIPTRPCRARRC